MLLCKGRPGDSRCLCRVPPKKWWTQGWAWSRTAQWRVDSRFTTSLKGRTLLLTATSAPVWLEATPAACSHLTAFARATLAVTVSPARLWIFSRSRPVWYHWCFPQRWLPSSREPLAKMSRCQICWTIIWHPLGCSKQSYSAQQQTRLCPPQPAGARHSSIALGHLCEPCFHLSPFYR